MLIRISAVNRGPDAAPLHLLPTLWFRNDWSWTPATPEPLIAADRGAADAADGRRTRRSTPLPAVLRDRRTTLLFTENETQRARRLWRASRVAGYVKDAFHDHVVDGRRDA